MLSSPVVHCKFNLVCFVNVKFVQLVQPPIISCGLGSTLEAVLNLYNDESLWAPTKASCGGVVYVCNSVDPKRQVTAQRFPLTWDAQTIICKSC